MKRQRQKKGPYVAVPKAIMASDAWREMSPEARLLWIELRGWLRNDGLNNGKVYRSCRNAAEAIGINKSTVQRCYAELEHYGFLVKTADGFLGCDGHGIATYYRFTDLAHGSHAATRDYERWDGELYTCRMRKRGLGNGNLDMYGATGHLKAQPMYGAPVHTAAPSEAARMYGATVQGVRRNQTGFCFQGSSTVRTPAQAGEAGSSPAPVANLTTMVLDIVNGQLDGVATRRRPAVKCEAEEDWGKERWR